jgi:hypothetical protein
MLGHSVRGYQKAETGVATARQLNATADHDRLMIEQGAKVVVFFAETMSVSTTHRRFRGVLRIRWAPARNTAFHFYCNSEEQVRRKKNDLGPSAVRLPENSRLILCPNLRQLNCLSALSGSCKMVPHHTLLCRVGFSEHHFRPSRHVTSLSSASQPRTFLAAT